MDRVTASVPGNSSRVPTAFLSRDTSSSGSSVSVRVMLTVRPLPGAGPALPGAFSGGNGSSPRDEGLVFNLVGVGILVGGFIPFGGAVEGLD